MTNDMVQLQGLLEKSVDADVLRDVIGFASQRLLESGRLPYEPLAEHLQLWRAGIFGRIELAERGRV